MDLSCRTCLEHQMILGNPEIREYTITGIKGVTHLTVMPPQCAQLSATAAAWVLQFPGTRIQKSWHCSLVNLGSAQEAFPSAIVKMLMMVAACSSFFCPGAARSSSNLLLRPRGC